MKIQNHSNNTSFQGLKTRKIDVDHARKFIEPVMRNLIKIGNCCSLKIKEKAVDDLYSICPF